MYRSADLRRHVATVGDGVELHRHARRGDRPGRGEAVPGMPVHASVGDDSEKGAPVPPEVFNASMKSVSAGSSAKLPSSMARSMRPRSIATIRPAPNVHVTDLGIAHLSGRQTDVAAVRHERGVRAGLHDPVEGGGSGERGRIGGGVGVSGPSRRGCRERPVWVRAWRASLSPCRLSTLPQPAIETTHQAR